MRKANQRVKKASKAKTQFLENISHELKTPLNAIIGFNHLLKDSLNHPDLAKDYADKIDQSSKLLLSIINDVLDMSDLENEQLELVQKPFNIKNNFYSVTSFYYQQCLKKGIRYESTVTHLEHELLIGDIYRLHQIVLNLLSNAIAFTEPGGQIDVNLSEKNLTENSVLLCLVVRDTGRGMSEDFQKRLFSAFEQEDPSTVRSHDGCGLGLSLTKRLVTLMGGHISVQSKLGEGSTFSVSAPFLFQKTPKCCYEGCPFANFHVLIIDHHIETCKYLNSLTQQWGIQSDYATSRSGAFDEITKKIAEGKAYNLFILDTNMPEINGFDLFANLQKLLDAHPVTILLSGHDPLEYKTLLDKKKKVFFLQKPIFPSELFNTLLSSINIEEHFKPPVENPSSMLKDLNLLLVEDNKINQLIAKRILEKSGAKITIANNGQEAITLIQNNPTHFDIILMDIQMPIMDGYEATRLIRKMNTDYTTNVLIYAMTANTFQSDINKALDAGMNGHFGKPIDPIQLINTLSKDYEKQQHSK